MGGGEPRLPGGAQAGGTLIGVVLNNVDSRHDEGYSYYSSYNDYYAKETQERKAKPATTAVAPRRSLKNPQDPAPVPTAPNGESKKAAARSIDPDEY